MASDCKLACEKEYNMFANDIQVALSMSRDLHGDATMLKHVSTKFLTEE